MFRNRFFGLKLAAVLAGIAALGVTCVLREEAVHPTLDRILLRADRLEGSVVRVDRARVVASDADGFDIEVGGVRARVTPAAPLAPGEEIDLTAKVQARGPSLRLEAFQRRPSGWPARNGGFLSLLLSILVVLNFLRHFAWRPSAARVEGVRE